jgi:hypothetical protein
MQGNLLKNMNGPILKNLLKNCMKIFKIKTVGFIPFLFFCYFFSFIIESPLRFVLFKVHLSVLLYLRDMVLVFLVYLYFVKIIKKLVVDKYTLVLFQIILFFSFIGFIYTSNFLMVPFGIKTLLPFIAAFVWGEKLIDSILNSKKVIWFFYIACCCGLIINLFYNYPWDNLNYSIGNFNVRGVRTFTAIEVIRRLNGFSNSPQKISDQIMILTLIYFCMFRGYKKWLIWICGLVFLVLTTCKTVIICLIIVGIFSIIKKIIPPKLKILQKSLIIPLLLIIGLPLISQNIVINSNGKRSIEEEFLLGSLFSRGQSTWPDAFNLIATHGNWLTGRGIGGIGGVQTYFEPELYSPGDNMFVYLYGLFGIFAFFIIFLYFYKSQFIKLNSSKNLFFFYLSVFIFWNGITTHGIEDGFMLIFYGLLMFYLLNMKKLQTIGGVAPI